MTMNENHVYDHPCMARGVGLGNGNIQGVLEFYINCLEKYNNSMMSVE